VRAALSAIAKTLLFTAIVPVTIVGIVPWRLRGDAPVGARGAEFVAAMTVIFIGIAIYLHTAFWSFAAIGGGTPAPIAPTKILVVHGLYRFVRNPMYIGVELAVLGQAWLFHSFRILVYLAFAAGAVYLFVVFYEEPTLRKRYGDQYDRYRATVPRWIPKLKL
jgi:protein-S-isoprenylcysteine O-methyltransferase Ste14